MDLVPVTLAEAQAFVAQHHRHSRPPISWKFGVGLEIDGQLAAVAMAGRPVARNLDDGKTLEILRVCTLGQRNASSRLYGALTRAAAALGWKRLVTYTLASEPGASLKASGWTREAELPARGECGWSTPARPRMQTDMFGGQTIYTEPKTRWIKHLR